MDTVEQVRAFIRESFFVDDFQDDESFLRSGIVDSIGMLHLMTFVEETYGMEVADDEVVPENFDSLRGLVAFIERCRAKKSA